MENQIRLAKVENTLEIEQSKIDELISKIDKLSEEVNEIKLNQLKEDSDIRTRVTTIESTLTTLKWVTGIGLSALGIIVAYITLFVTILH